MRKKIDPVVDEAIETLNMKDGPTRRRLIEGAGLFSATAAASALIAACSSSSSSSAAPTSTSTAAKAAAGNFPTTPKWKFTFVNHVTDNAFFTPTQYGFAGLRRAARPADAGLDRRPVDPADRAHHAVGLQRGGHGGFSGHRDHRGLGHLVHRPHQQRAARGHPGDHVQRERFHHQPHQRPRLHRPGAVHIGPGGRHAARLADDQGRHGGRLHRPARRAEHPAAHGRRDAGPGGRRHEGDVRQHGCRHRRLGDAGSAGAARVPAVARVLASRAPSRSTAATPPCSAPRWRNTAWSARCTPADSTWSRRP